MFSRLVRLTFSVMFILATIAPSAAIAFPIEQPTQSLETLRPVRHDTGTMLGRSNAARRPSADLPERALEMQRPASIVLRPDLRPLAAGTPQTVTVKIVPDTLIAKSGATATITATVYDITGDVVDGAILTGVITPERGSVGSFPATVSGVTTSTWTATPGSTVGTGTIQVITDTASGSAPITLTADVPYTVTLTANPLTLTVGGTSALTATVKDQYGNAVADGTNVTYVSDIGSPPPSGTTTNGIATSSLYSTLAGTAHITATSGGRSGFAPVVFNPGPFYRLSIENGTGAPINAHTMSVYDALTVYAVGYDVYSNTIGSQTADWGGTGVVAGRLSPLNGISTTFTAAMSGTGFITATSGGITGTTGVITVQAPVLQISKSASPDPVTPGTQLHYTIRYTNTSTFAAQGVIITETYPLSTTYDHASPSPTTPNNVWSIPSLAAGTSSTIDVYVNVAGQMPVGSVLTNTVRIGAFRAATAIYTATTQVNSQPILIVDVADTIDPVRPGQEFAYNILYRNDGNAPATGLRITDTFPSQVTFVTATPSPVITGTNYAIWLPNTLNGGGASRLIAATVRVKSPAADRTVMTDTVTIDSNETVPLTVTEPTVVNAPMLQLTKSANPVAPTANGLLTYTLQYTNSGSSDASNVVITDAVPLNTVFQSATSGYSINGNIVTWNLGSVPQQTSDALILAVKVNNSLPNGTILTNTARITSAELATAFVALTNTVSSAPNVSLLKSDGVTFAAAGDVLMYQLAYTNTGTAPAQNVVITDRLPANVTNVGCACTFVGGVYTFTIGTVTAAQGGVVTVSVRVNSPLPAGVRSITNTAYIQTSTSGDNPADNSAQDVDTISTVPALALTVAYDANTPYPGKTITYTLRYTNTSLMATTGVVISTTRSPYVKVIPTGWSFIGGDDIYTVNNLAAGQAGTINYVVVLTSTFTPAMNAFANTFLIHDGGPGGLPVARQTVTTTIGIPDLIIENVQLPAATAPSRPFTATLTIRNIGLGRACNPNVIPCGQTWIDAFVDPNTPPLSYPFGGYGDPYARVPQIAPGLTATVNITNIVVSATQQPFVYFKVDNYACPGSTCLPPGSLGGLVPESNEYNNVTGPVFVPRYAVYLPSIRKK